MSRSLAEGTYSALVVTLPVDPAIALGMVPGGLQLADQTLTPSGSHPLMLMFGHHTRVHPTFLPIRGWSYHEFLVAVPWICPPDAETVFSTMPRLYLDSLAMVLAGWVYAFPKCLAKIRSTELTYRVEMLFGHRGIVSADWTAVGTSGSASEFPEFEGVRPTFEQPFIQRFPPLPFERSVMRFDLDSAIVQPERATISIEKEFLRDLPLVTKTVEPLSETPLGGFTIEVPWTLSAPHFGIGDGIGP